MAPSAGSCSAGLVPLPRKGLEAKRAWKRSCHLYSKAGHRSFVFAARASESVHDARGVVNVSGLLLP